MLQKINRVTLTVIIIGSAMMTSTELSAEARATADHPITSDFETAASNGVAEKGTTIYCQGTLVDTYVKWNGHVNIKASWSGTWHTICYLGADRAGVEPRTCAAWLTLVKTAVEQNLTVVVPYVPDDGTTCESLPKYNAAPRPSYIRLLNPGP